MARKDEVETIIAESRVAVFSKTWCPYCKRAKALLQDKYPNVQVKVTELDSLDDGSSIQDYLHEKTGQRTVPNIFINKSHIGGCDDLFNLEKSGKLAELIGA